MTSNGPDLSQVSIDALTAEILAAIISDAQHGEYPEQAMHHLLQIAGRAGLDLTIDVWRELIGFNPNTTSMTSLCLTFLLIGWDARGTCADAEKFREIVTK